MAEVIPFPLARRQDLIQRQASWFAQQASAAAEKNLYRQVHVQRETMVRRGIARERIEPELQALEGAIRATVT